MSVVPSFRRALLRVSTVAGLVCSLCIPVAQARPLAEVLPQFDRDVERIFGAYRIPGAAVAIVDHGKVVYIKTLGVGSTRAQNPVNEHTVFRLASVSKTFAAVLAGKANAEGRLDFSAPLSRYVPGFRLKYDGSNQLTVRNVLSHTSGLPHNANDGLLEGGMSYPQLLQKTEQLGASCPIGRCFGYQNILYSTIGDVLSRQYGQSYADLLSSHLFRPLGMSDASTGRASMLNNANVAVPHTRGGAGWAPRPITQPYYNVLPAAGVNASISDMSKYLAAVMGHRPDVLPASVMQNLTVPLIRSPKEGATSKWRQTRIKNPMYGMGWRIFQYNGDHKMIFHAGGLSGVRSRLGFLPEKDIGLVMLWNANESRPEVLMPMLFDRLLDLPSVDYLDGAAGGSGDFYTHRSRIAPQENDEGHDEEGSGRSAIAAATTAGLLAAPAAKQTFLHQPQAAGASGIRSLTAARVGYDPAPASVAPAKTPVHKAMGKKGSVTTAQAKKPVTAKASTKKAVAKKSVAKKPVTKKVATKSSAAKKPVAKKPVGKKAATATKAPATHHKTPAKHKPQTH